MGALRPGVEAILLAAVAFGAAQVGWSALTPQIAYGSSEEPGADAITMAPQTSAEATVRTPFSPALDGSVSNAASALLANIKLAGVRVSSDPSRSGCILTLEDGAQHAFLIGEEIANGVRLAEVTADYVLLSYEGGQSQLALEARPSFSFARALMGEQQLEYSDVPEDSADEPEAPPAAEPPSGDVPVAQIPEEAPAAPAPEAPSTKVAAADAPIATTTLYGPPAETPFSATPPADSSVEQGSPLPGEASAAGAPLPGEAATTAAGIANSMFDPVAPTMVTPENIDWLSTTLATPPSSEGDAGWRIGSPPPMQAAAAGLHEGDVIVAVNGMGPERMFEAMSAATTGEVELQIVRNGWEHISVTICADAPA